jgi:chromate transporter
MVTAGGEARPDGPQRPYRTYWDLSVAMIRVGVFGYGGGPSVIPLFRHEVVIRYKWMSDQEFAEILAFANALPGPIATKMAAHLGYQLRGWLGAVAAVVAHILPSTLAMLLLLSAFHLFQHSPVVEGMIAAVSPVIAVMLGQLAYEFAQKALRGLGRVLGSVFTAIAVVLLVVLQLPQAVVVLAFLAYGTVHLWLIKRLRRLKPGEGRDS